MIWNSKSQQQRHDVLAETTKKENDSVYYIKNARITTSEDVENLDYFVRILQKASLYHKRKLSPAEIKLYIADVPTQFLPFAYFPMTKTEKVVLFFQP